MQAKDFVDTYERLISKIEQLDPESRLPSRV